MTGNELKEIADRNGIVEALNMFKKPIMINLPLQNDNLMMPIQDLPLSVRSTNALMRAKCDTVGKVCEALMTEGALKHIRNLGKKSIAEINTVVLSEGYRRLDDTTRLNFCSRFASENTIGD